MQTRFLVAALAVALGAGLFVAAPTRHVSAQSGGVYCLHYGETLSGVAAMYGTTAWAIAQYNGIPNPNYVRAGQCVQIPPRGWGAYYGGYYPKPVPPPYYGGYHPQPKPVPAYGGKGYYCVHYGDTLSGIAARYGVSPWSIAYANGLSNPNYIRGGQCLYIPGY
jgi:N-acetylmuramoyl-L-alanine amidase